MRRGRSWIAQRSGGHHGKFDVYLAFEAFWVPSAYWSSAGSYLFNNPLGNTTIAAIATNAALRKEEINKVAQMAQNGLRDPTATSPKAPPMPPVSPAQHKHSKSVPRGIVPDRVSSMATSQSSTRPGRGRSNTTGARPRQSARISYSLFPIATPPPPTGVPSST